MDDESVGCRDAVDCHSEVEFDEVSETERCKCVLLEYMDFLTSLGGDVDWVRNLSEGGRFLPSSFKSASAAMLEKNVGRLHWR